MAAGVEVFQVKRVIDHLIASRKTVLIRANLKLNNENEPACENYRVSALAHARDHKFKRKPADHTGELGLKETYLRHPDIALQFVEVVRMMARKNAEHVIGCCRAKKAERLSPHQERSARADIAI
jgi:hypothetical protein